MISHLLVGGALRQSDSGSKVSYQPASPDFCAATFLKWHAWMAAGRQSATTIPANVISYNNSLYVTVVGRKLFVTEEGYVGFGPSQIEEGDTAAILGGGKCPYILRRSNGSKEASNDSYRLLGGSYIHGMMNGEAVKAERDLRNLTLQ